MKRITIMLLLFLTSLAYANSQDERHNRNMRQVVSNLETLRDSYMRYLPPEEQRKAIALINSTITMVFNKEKWSDIDTNNILNDSEFEKIFQDIKSQWPDQERTKMALLIFKEKKIKSAQLSQILSLYTFDNYKVELIKALKPKIVDIHNSACIVNSITSIFTRDEVTKILQE